MAKNRSKQVMKSRLKSGAVRLELLVTPEMKARFEELATVNRSSKVELFEKLVEKELIEEFNGADKARELLEQ